jgi:hypothetical protein
VIAAQTRVEEGLKDAVKFIQNAKKMHDELETFYVPAMDFDGIAAFREKLMEELRQIVGSES